MPYSISLNSQNRYVIKIYGQLDDSWLDWFSAAKIHAETLTDNSRGDHVLECRHGSGWAGWPDPAITRTWDRGDVHPTGLDLDDSCSAGILPTSKLYCLIIFL
jgi:hypothetical protein